MGFCELSRRRGVDGLGWRLRRCSTALMSSPTLRYFILFYTDRHFIFRDRAAASSEEGM
jgi:hypothetical protein